jgi:peroxiredoxin Q/BCP
MQPGELAPDFSLPDQDGTIHTLSSYRGKWVLLYFYPQDDTPGCTAEACGIRDEWEKFQKQDVVVLGVSPDAVASHKAFQEKYKLPFTLLADPDKTVLTPYDAWGERNNFGKITQGVKRSSVLINPEGKIIKHYAQVTPESHAKIVLSNLHILQKNS